MAYDPATIEPRWQRYWDEHQTFRPARPDATSRSTTCSTCFPTRRARPARRPPGGLHRHRHHRPLQAHARLQRAAPDGLGRLRPAGRASTPSRPARTRAITTDDEHRQLPPPAEDARLLLRLGPRGHHHRSRTTTAGPSGSSSSCTSRAWPTRPRCRSTGARRWAPCWPTRRSSTA